LSGTQTFTANQSTAATFTVTSNATSDNTAGAIVSRDASGNFSAGTITAALSGNASTATKLAATAQIQGIGFDGSANITVVTAGTGVSVTGTAVSIGQAVGTTSNVTFNDLTVSGNLTVSGTTTTLNTETLDVEDKNIQLGNVASPSNTTANGGGITLKAGATDGDKTFNWLSSNSAWNSSEHINLPTGKTYQINGTNILSSSTYIGTTQVALNRASANLGLTGISSVAMPGATSGTITITPAATAGTTAITIPATSGTLAIASDTHFIGTTSVALNRASANLGLTGISSVAMPGATSGTITITPAATAGTTAITIPATSGTLVTTGDSGTVTNTMLAGSIADSKLSQITTAGKVANSATTATSENTAGAIVARDVAGDFSAGIITNTGIRSTGAVKVSTLADLAILSTDAEGYLTGTNVLQTFHGGTGSSYNSHGFANLKGFATWAISALPLNISIYGTYYNVFTGSAVSNQNIVLPSAGTIGFELGLGYELVNKSTGTLTVQTATLVTLCTVPPNYSAVVIYVSTGNTAANWQTVIRSPVIGGSSSSAPEIFTFGGTGTPTAGSDLSPYLRVFRALTCSAASLVTKTPPTGNFTATILRSANNGTSFPDTVATITVSSGNRVGTATPTVQLAVGDLLRIDISSVNGAADWTCQLQAA
jgi:hypothetical protein